MNFVTESHAIDKTQPESWKALRNALKERQYRSVFCPHESFTSAKFVKLLDAEVTVGYKNWWNFLFFDERVERPMRYPEALRQLYLLTPFIEEWDERFKKLDLSKRLHNTDSQDSYEASTQAVPEWADMQLPLSDIEVQKRKSNTACRPLMFVWLQVVFGQLRLGVKQSFVNSVSSSWKKVSL